MPDNIKMADVFPMGLRVGYFMDSPRYRSWSDEQKRDANREENERLFLNFIERDEGRSRIFVAHIPDNKHRTAILHAVDNHDRLTSELKAERKAMRAVANKICHEGMNRHEKDAYDLIEKLHPEWFAVNSKCEVTHTVSKGEK